MDKIKKIEKLKQDLELELELELNFFKKIEPYINTKTVGKMPVCPSILCGVNARLPIEEMCDKYPNFKKEFDNGKSRLESLIALHGFSEYSIYYFLDNNNNNNNNNDNGSFDIIKDECLFYYNKLNKIFNEIKEELKKDIEKQIFLLG